MWRFISESKNEQPKSTTIKTLATPAQKSEIPKNRTTKHPIIKFTENEIITLEQILKESFLELFLNEGETFVEAVDLYINQLENKNVDKKLEESLTSILKPYIFEQVTFFETIGSLKNNFEFTLGSLRKNLNENNLFEIVNRANSSAQQKLSVHLESLRNSKIAVMKSIAVNL